MSGEDLLRLESILAREDFSDNTMPLETLDGFLSALIVGPEVVLPSEYLPEVFGGEPPVWDSLDEAQEALELIQGLWNMIVDRLDYDIDDIESHAAALPLLGYPQGEGDEDSEPENLDPLADVPEGFPVGLLWSLGFMKGLQMRTEAWDSWMEAHPELLEPISSIARLGLIDCAELGDAMDSHDLEPYSHEARVETVARLPAILQAANDLRMAEPPELPSMTVRKPPKIGRNEPCPCGSGRKFKRCCGEPFRPH
jgi:uncharacterized protein